MIAWQIILYTLASAMYFSLIVMAFGFILRSAKFFNIALGGAFLVGGYMMFLFYRTYSIPFIPAVLLSSCASGMYFSLCYLYVFRPLLARKAKSQISLIASFGVLTATSAILGIIFGNQPTFIPRHLSDIGTVKILGAHLNTTELVLIISVAVIIFASHLVRSKTRFGRAVRAVEDDGEVAELVGISKGKTLLKIFFIAGVFAGLTGIVEGLNSGLIPASGLFYMLPTIVAVIIGGMQSFWGGIIGAFILAIAQQLTILFFGGSWVTAVPFVLLIIILLVRPEGILKR